ncbi:MULTISPECIES: IS5 family transposase [Alphaproteobacteria]|uniref:IS5 family transposase n=1 Tax=Roseibium sp. TaxID=1936156 RepID=UPI001D10B440|nr:IS5 family transposase [Aurantiacibacter atlanticus]
MEDTEWAFFEPFLMAIRGQGGRPASNHRLVLDGIFWIARTGAAWRDLPEEFGKWSSVYRQFRRWTLAGLWELVLDALNDSGAAPDSVQMIDSTVIRAHHLAAGGKRGTQRQGFGRSKGGFTSKIHLISNAHGLPVRAEVTGGEVSDFKGFDALVDDDLPTARVFLADRGYDSDHIRKTIAERGGTPVIPAKANRKEPIPHDTVTYALRNRIERCFAKLKCSRRLATRYDKTSASYLGFIHIAAVRLWTNQFVNRA